MYRNRLTLIAATLAGSLLAFAGFSAGPAHADVDPDSFVFGYEINCNDLTLTAKLSNGGGSVEGLSFVMETSEGFAVGGSFNSQNSEDHSQVFSLSNGVIVESVGVRDASLDTFISTDLDLIFFSEDDCYRKAVRKVITDDMQISCVDGWLHLSIRVDNAGDYDESLAVWADGAWPDEATAGAASNAGWSAFEQFEVPALGAHEIDVDFKVDDMLHIVIRNWDTDEVIYEDGPRALQGSELACGGNVPELESVGGETPTETPSSGSGAGLPATGATSWVLALVALLLSGAGALLVRSTRRPI